MAQAGRRNQYIAVESKVIVKNEYLDNVPTWTLFARIWAQVITSRPQEAFTGGGLRLTDSIVFRTDPRDDITEGMRVLYRGAYYDVTGVVQVGIGAGAQATDIHCQKGVRDGI